ncbi:MAG TPA: hypothetical protein VN723_08090 [Rhizomicrobium sp.]|jgi:hypothetical protein|nr:hypothetical protein [Rhizomicrobium sp.]
MSLFDMMESKCEEMAGRYGIPAEQVRALSATLQSKMGDGAGHMEALEATAREHGLPLDQVQALIDHCGGNDALMGAATNFAGGLFKKN